MRLQHLARSKTAEVESVKRSDRRDRSGPYAFCCHARHGYNNFVIDSRAAEPERPMGRRLAAIFAADVVGYSRLMAANENDTHTRYKALRKDIIKPEIAEHHGRVVKLMGDGLLVEFASAVDAVECAVAIQKGVAECQHDLREDQKIAFRIGINIGDIIIEDEDIYGGGVNIAARLEELAEPGGVCIARNVYNQVKDKVAFGFEPMGEHQVKNIPDPVVVYRVLPGPFRVIQVPKLKRVGARAWRWVTTVVALVTLAGVVGVAAWLRPWAVEVGPATQAGLDRPVPDRPSIVVLPFDNLSGDPEQEYLSDGIAEDLITDLSKISGLSVAARTAAFQYRSQNLDPHQIARDLAVRYVLEGSVRRAENRVRINAKLIDTSTGHQRWSGRFDRPLEDIFALEDEITQTVVSALKLKLTESERDLLGQRSTDNIEAYELYLRGIELYRRKSRDDIYQARRLLQRAIDLDPKFSEAYARLAHTYYYGFEAGWEGPASLTRAVELRQEADALDDLRKALSPE
jgi:adenylate cyclase